MLTEDAQRFADQMGIQLYETSAKDNINVEQVTDYHLHIDLFCLNKKVNIKSKDI